MAGKMAGQDLANLPPTRDAADVRQPFFVQEVAPGVAVLRRPVRFPVRRRLAVLLPADDGDANRLDGGSDAHFCIGRSPRGVRSGAAAAAANTSGPTGVSAPLRAVCAGLFFLSIRMRGSSLRTRQYFS